MSLLGIDVGTSGCKAVLFSEAGRPLASAYEEYDPRRPRPGWAELDSARVWGIIKRAIAKAARGASSDPVEALAVSSLGEAVVPVSRDRRILGPSILNFDARGAEYLDGRYRSVSDERLYGINGNPLGNNYSLTKLMWIKRHRPELYRRVDYFLHWSGFVSFMLGAEPVVDYSLANRTLLFDLELRDWSDYLIDAFALDREKLPRALPSGIAIGAVSRGIAEELGLPANIPIVSGAHDQCANGVGCGVIEPGRAMYGMGTFLCMMPVFDRRLDTAAMLARGLNTEHHAVAGRFVSFIYNQGGALVKWYRDTFAAVERRQAEGTSRDIYQALISEIPATPSKVIVLPYFTATGPPKFIENSSGVITGLRLETSRGEILKGILEGTTFYLRECFESLPGVGMEIGDFRVVGGGSKSDAWIQISADILGRPFVRVAAAEAGALGAAIIAGTGSGRFLSPRAGVEAMVKLERTFYPDPQRRLRYDERFAAYRRLHPLLADYLSGT